MAKRGVTIDGTPTQAKRLAKRHKNTPKTPPPTKSPRPIFLHSQKHRLGHLDDPVHFTVPSRRPKPRKRRSEKDSERPYFLPVGVPDGEKFYFDNSSQFQQSIAISPDGKWFAYISGAKPDGNHSLWLHSVKDDTRINLITSKKSVWGLNNPFFSHDSRWLAVFDNGKLKRFSTDTHELNVICDESVTFGGVWSDDGTIYLLLTKALNSKPLKLTHPANRKQLFPYRSWTNLEMNII